MSTSEGVATPMSTVCRRDFDTEGFYAPLGAILQVERHGWSLTKSCPRCRGAAGQRSQYLRVKLWDVSLELGKQWDLSPDPEVDVGSWHTHKHTEKKHLCRKKEDSEIVHEGRRLRWTKKAWTDIQTGLCEVKSACISNSQEDPSKMCMRLCVYVPIMLFGVRWCSRALNLAGSLVGVIYHSTGPLPGGGKGRVWVCMCYRKM